MTMFEKPTSAPEIWSLQELVNAGWSEDDLSWEATSEETVAAACAGDFERAKDEAGSALRLARETFEQIDPRLGTSLANFGICLALTGDKNDLPALVAKALETWRSAHPWIARMQAPRVARSSMFHLRMEALHRDTYRALWQKRWNATAQDAAARLEALRDNPGTLSAPDAAVFTAWRRERPAMLNDTRKLLAAGQLLLAPAANPSA